MYSGWLLNGVGGLLQKGLQEYARANGGQFPDELSQLAELLDPALDTSVLDRWEIAHKSAFPSISVGNPITTQKAPVDSVFDERVVLGLNGQVSTGFLEDTARQVLAPVFEAYRTAHNGQPQSDYSQLAPYVTTPEQQAALQDYMLKY